MLSESAILDEMNTWISVWAVETESDGVRGAMFLRWKIAVRVMQLTWCLNERIAV